MNKLFQNFVSKWVSTYHGDPIPESKESLKRLEVTYSFTLPNSYIDFLTTVGPVNTPDILDSVVEMESELGSLQDIYAIDEAIKLTNEYQSAGMPKNLLAFAGDAMGNKFCFDMSQCVAPHCPDLPVYFFDHDFCTIDVAANSFLEFLRSYVELEKAG